MPGSPDVLALIGDSFLLPHNYQLVTLSLLYYPHWERSVGLHCTVIDELIPLGTFTGSAVSENSTEFLNSSNITFYMAIPLLPP